MSKIKTTWMTPADDRFTMKRAKYTLRFVARHLRGKAETVLDVGDVNMVGNYVASECDLRLENTSGDLDYDFKAFDGKYDAVFCFEILEHLLAPKYFLMELRKYLHEQSQVFISYPRRPKFLWTPIHFHEYDASRFRYLLQQTGYEICDLRIVHFPQPWWGRFTGIRPFLRSFVNRDVLVYAKLIF